MARLYMLTISTLIFYVVLGQETAGNKVDAVANLNALASYAGTGLEGEIVYVKGYRAIDDGGGGMFVWKNSVSQPLLDGMVVQVQGKPEGRWLRLYDPNKGVNVRWFGAGLQVGAEDSASILLAHTLMQNVIYPAGRYKFTARTNPNLYSGIVVEKDAHIDGFKFNDILSVDDSSRVIGLQQNHLEESHINLQSNVPITTGVILPAPLSTKSYDDDLSVIAHWYNDFGLEKTRVANGAAGSLTWYYWSWAHTGNSTGYDPTRHPLLGWYKGDETNVLDWQCYWLREYGITGVNLFGTRIDTTVWQEPSNKDYWIYQLFHNVKNFKGLKYILWGLSGPSKGHFSAQQIEADWMNILANFHQKYDNYFFIRKNDRIYPVIYLFEADKLRGTFDDYNGSTNLTKFLIRMGGIYKNAGFGGLCIFARHPSSSLNVDALEENDVLYIPAGYSNVNGVFDAATYEDYVNGFTTPATRTIVNVVTAHESKYPHPSGWTQAGSTPKLFEQLLSKAAIAIKSVNYLPKVIQIYNVAEWAEGGPMLQPNVRDRFGYLQAVKNVREFNVKNYSLFHKRSPGSN